MTVLFSSAISDPVDAERATVRERGMRLGCLKSARTSRSRPPRSFAVESAELRIYLALTS
jgi:hypothetical protein